MYVVDGQTNASQNERPTYIYVSFHYTMWT